MLIDYSSRRFPARDTTDGQFLYLSLGSFWTQVFNDKNVLKGYTVGMAEELIQAYLNLTTVVRQYSVNDIDLLRKEKWQPLLIKKSEYNKSPLLFETSGAIFGNQPAEDPLYPSQLFRFGFSKEGSSNSVFSFYCGKQLKKIGVIADRLIAPTVVLIEGADILLKESKIYFNSDIFKNPKIPRVRLVDEFGEVITFRDNEGRIHEDELVLLWIHMAEYDDDALYQNFGTLFDIRMTTSQAYKDILSALMNISVEGPTIQALRFALSALLATPVVLDKEETVQDIYDDERQQYVVTDKHVYKVPIGQYLRDEVYVDNVIYCGETITDSFKVVDTVIDPVWWKTEVKSNKLAFSSHVFAASTENQLFFENTLKSIVQFQDLVQWRSSGLAQWTNAVNIAKLHQNVANPKPIVLRKTSEYLQYRYADQMDWFDLLSWTELTAGLADTGDNIEVRISYRLDFPVYGRAADVKAFQDYVNDPSRKYQLLDKLNLPMDTSSRVTINPLDFVFTNIFKSNTLLIKVYFDSAERLNLFFDLLPMLQNYLPPHVYILVYVQLNLGAEELPHWNYGLTIPDFPGENFGLDGSVRGTGARPELKGEDPMYYKDYLERVFCISVGPYRELVEGAPATKQPLHYNIDPDESADPNTLSNLDLITLRNNLVNTPGPGIRCGVMRTEIPEFIIPPGESTPRAPTTREVPAILLIDF